MHKLNYAIVVFIFVCVVSILLSGCQSNTDNDILPNADQIENSDVVDVDAGFDIDVGVDIDVDVDADDVELIEVESTPNPSPSSSFITMYVKVDKYGSKVNVREYPSINSNIVGKLEHGDCVEVYSNKDGWVNIWYDGSDGFISADYLIFEEPSKLNPPVINISPGEIYINVYKEERTLQLWSGSDLIGEYNAGLGFSPVGHKEKEGDGRTPEGSYYLCLKNPNSSFYLSLGVSYPGISDAKRGLDSDIITQSQYNSIVNSINSKGVPLWNTALGGQIMIHGNGGNSDWTAGCIAVDNEVMDLLWEYCSVGTKINIYP